MSDPTTEVRLIPVGPWIKLPTVRSCCLLSVWSMRVRGKSWFNWVTGVLSFKWRHSLHVHSQHVQSLLYFLGVSRNCSETRFLCLKHMLQDLWHWWRLAAAAAVVLQPKLELWMELNVPLYAAAIRWEGPVTHTEISVAAPAGSRNLSQQALHSEDDADPFLLSQMHANCNKELTINVQQDTFKKPV